MQFRLAVEFKVALDGGADVFQCFGHRRALRMTARQFGATDGDAFRMFQQRDVEFGFHHVGKLCSGFGFVNLRLLFQLPPILQPLLDFLFHALLGGFVVALGRAEMFPRHAGWAMVSNDTRTGCAVLLG